MSFPGRSQQLDETEKKKKNQAESSSATPSVEKSASFPKMAFEFYGD